MTRWLVLAALLVGCRPYMSAGLDAHSKVSGPLGNMVTQPVATAREDPSTVEPISDHRSYSLALGAGIQRFGIEAGLHLHEVNTSSFSLPSSAGVDPTSPRYLLGTASVDLRLRWLLRRHLSSDMHLGPAGGILLDRADGGHQVGNGYRVGMTASVTLGPIAGFVDVYETDIAFGDGPAAGKSTLTGVTVGVALR